VHAVSQQHQQRPAVCNQPISHVAQSIGHETDSVTQKVSRISTWDSDEVVQRHGGEDPVAARDCLSRGTSAENAASCMSVASSTDASERAGQPSSRRQARAHQAGVGGAQAFGQRLEERPPPVAAEESHGHSRPRVLLLPCPAGWMQQKGDSERFINVSVTETICACALVPVQHHWNRYA
jgi:hypothetical protein